MKTRYTKSIAGRVTPDIRNKVRPGIQKFAAANNVPFNVVFAAVMWAAEQMRGRVTLARVQELITERAVREYEQELNRKTEARRVQIVGLIRRALPLAKRTDAIINDIFTRVANFKGSIPALKDRVIELACVGHPDIPRTLEATPKANLSEPEPAG